jgi:hypothetical protein
MSEYNMVETNRTPVQDSRLAERDYDDFNENTDTPAARGSRRLRRLGGAIAATGLATLAAASGAHAKNLTL